MTRPHISQEVRQRIRVQAGDRCGYCLAAQRYVYALLQIEHIIPRAAGGSDEEDNLWLACSYCNDFKNDQTKALDPVTQETVSLFNPRRQRWAEHFTWSADGTQIVGLTPCGRATVIALQLNFPRAVLTRAYWVSAGWHPPQDA